MGMQTVAFCEAEPFPRAILRCHRPGVPDDDDVCTLTAARLRADGVPRPEIVCGGFPGQDISLAGQGAGIAGARSRLISPPAHEWSMPLLKSRKPQTC